MSRYGFWKKKEKSSSDVFFPVKTVNKASLGLNLQKRKTLTLCVATSVDFNARCCFLEVDFYLKVRGAPSKGGLLFYSLRPLLLVRSGAGFY